MYPLAPVLVVDDEEHALRSCETALRLDGITHVVRCQDSREAMGHFEHGDIEAVILDLTMPHLSGQDLLTLIARQHPQVPVIIMTGMNDVQTAVACMQSGAFDYMVKPVEQRRLTSGLRRAIEARETRREAEGFRDRVLYDRLEHPEAFAGIVTRNPRMRALFQYVESVAHTGKPVLITGETGVGKELAARALHQLSGRSGAFVALNAAGLDDTLFSDALFGHVKGAFTGADTTRAGLIEKAAGGTLFLDEAGDLASASQVKLLRLLQESEYFPLGSDTPRRSGAAVLLATNLDLEAAAASGSFRRDLYYRLQTHRIHIPPLRERPDDLPLLVAHFIDAAAEALKKTAPTPPPELFHLLHAYPFPGNVRELEAMVFDAVSRHTGGTLSTSVFREHMDITLPTAGTAGTPDDSGSGNPFEGCTVLPTLRESADLLVSEAMGRAKNNQAVAARLLGISRTALNKRLHKGNGDDSD
jgi:DNA-binding NtrC family response regulator